MKEIEHLDFVRQQTDTLTRTIKACAVRLSELRSQLEVPLEDQLRELEDINARALDVWSSAVRAAEDDKQQLVNQVEDAVREIAAIKEQLGDELMSNAAAAELRELEAPHQRTIRAWYNEVMGKAHYWRGLRDQRSEQYQRLQGAINSIRQQLGMAPHAIMGPADISSANMEFLSLEHDKLQAERARRHTRLVELLDQVQVQAAELGEDGKQAALHAHPSLECAWDRDSQEVLQQVYSCTGEASTGGSSSSSSGLPDLSNATFRSLEAKLHDFGTLKAQRDAHAAEIMSVLHSLWDAMGIPPGSSERQMFVRMMTSGVRLYTKSLEKCMAEVRRLEEAKAAQMVGLVRDKAEELRQLCADTHVEAPAGLDTYLAALDSSERSPGAAADLLSRLVRMLAEVQVLAAKRSSILGMVQDLERSRQEQVWLRSYEADGQRYKGRNASKNLQRAIEAGKMRDAMGAKIARVGQALAEWKEAEGNTFLFDGRDYQAEVLPLLEMEQQHMAAERASKTQTRRQSGVGVMSSASKTRMPSSVGNRTPMPKAFDRALQERHSIAVVRHDPNWHYGPTNLTRSTAYLPASALQSPIALRRPSTASRIPSAPTPSRLPTTPMAAGRPGSAAGGLGGYSTPSGSVVRSGATTPSPGVAGSSSSMRAADVAAPAAPAAAGGGTPAERRTGGTSKVLSDILQRQALHDVATLSRSSPVAQPSSEVQMLDVEQEAREEQFKQLMAHKGRLSSGGSSSAGGAAKSSSGQRSHLDQHVSPTKKAMRGRG